MAKTPRELSELTPEETLALLQKIVDLNNKVLAGNGWNPENYDSGNIDNIWSLGQDNGELCHAYDVMGLVYAAINAE